MGGIFTNPEVELTYNRALARRRIRHLDRLIATQEVRISEAKRAGGDRSDAKLVLTLAKGADRLKEDRVRAHAALNRIEMALMGHYDNEIAHDVRELAEAINENRDVSSEDSITETEIAETQITMAESAVVAMPEAPKDEILIELE